MLNKKSVDDINVKGKKFKSAVISTFPFRKVRSQMKTVWWQPSYDQEADR